MTERIYLFRTKIFGWAVWVALDLDCWKELFIIYLTGRGEKRLISQFSILDISTVWAEEDRWIEGTQEINGKMYKTSTISPKYDNDKLSGWTWSVKDGIEKE